MALLSQIEASTPMTFPVKSDNFVDSFDDDLSSLDKSFTPIDAKINLVLTNSAKKLLRAEFRSDDGVSYVSW